MPRLALALSALLVLAPACAPARAPAAPVASHALTPAQIATRALPSIVTLRTADALGTGFVVREDGWIATNLHVVIGGPRLRVTFRDGKEMDAIEVLAASPEHDLALVRVDAKGLPALVLGNSDAMHPGDPVVAIGNPLGLEDTVSNGLVSARRKVSATFEVLQVSAPIAHGSSGGPIFNDQGEVIGVAAAVLQGGQNLAFGVPTRYLAPLMKDTAPIAIAEFAAFIAKLKAASAQKPKRPVMHLPVAMLDGCPTDAQKLVVKMLGEAVEVGAPLYNAGKIDACYHVYDGAAADLARKLPPACAAAQRTLAEAQKAAAAGADPSASAWTLRDAFDALFDVIARRQGG
jgi:S1-C subfamily serine protease